MTASVLITLLTDFGTRDPYVGVMKGVMAARCPRAVFVDLTHEVPPQDVRAAAFYLRASWPYFPAGTHHLVVVDPGVGTQRRMLVAETCGQRFCGPDNGLLPAALEGEEVRYRLLRERDWHGGKPSTTFHGRDHFAPSLAHLAAGGSIDEIAPEEVGPVLLEDASRPSLDEWRLDQPRTFEGRVEVVDHFGNLITNLPGELAREGRSVLEIAGRAIDRIVPTFAAAHGSDVVALVGSFGTFEVVVDRGSAARALGVGAGERVLLHWKP